MAYICFRETVVYAPNICIHLFSACKVFPQNTFTVCAVLNTCGLHQMFFFVLFFQISVQSVADDNDEGVCHSVTHDE